MLLEATYRTGSVPEEKRKLVGEVTNTNLFIVFQHCPNKSWRRFIISPLRRHVAIYIYNLNSCLGENTSPVERLVSAGCTGVQPNHRIM
jgi:hypothetical protein